MPAITQTDVKKTCATSAPAPSAEQLDEAIRKLVALWEPHHQGGLTVRCETGRTLNELLGSPLVRQEHGASTLERVSDQIGVSRSELSRMRKFAHVIPDLEAFHRDYPQCNTWTKVKVFLGTIDMTGQPVPKEAKATPPAKGVCRSIHSLQKKVEGVESDLTTDDRQRVITALEELAQAICGALSITVQVRAE